MKGHKAPVKLNCPQSVLALLAQTRCVQNPDDTIQFNCFLCCFPELTAQPPAFLCLLRLFVLRSLPCRPDAPTRGRWRPDPSPRALRRSANRNAGPHNMIFAIAPIHSAGSATRCCELPPAAQIDILLHDVVE